LLDILTSIKSFLGLGLVVLVLSFALWLIWPNTEEALTVKAQIAIQFFQLASTSLTILIAILVPIFSASCITIEKEQNSLDILLTTPLSPWTILLGKLIASATYFVILLLISMPILNLCVVIAGVEFWVIMDMYGVLLLCVITFSVMSLVCSCYCQRTYMALAISYCLILPPLVMLAYQFLTQYPQDSRFLFFFLIVMPLNAFLFWMAYHRFSILSIRGWQPKSKIIDEVFVLHQQLPLTGKASWFPSQILAPMQHAEYLPDTINPIYAKELYYEFAGSENIMPRLFILWSVIVSIPIAIWMFLGYPDVYPIFLIASLLLMVPALASSSFTHEYESGMYDILQTTPLTFATIFFGKAQATLRLACILWLVLLIPLLAGVLGNIISLTVFISIVFLSASLVLFLGLISLLISALSLNTMHALVRIYLGLFTICILPGLMGMLLWMLPEFASTAMGQRGYLFSLISPFGPWLQIIAKSSVSFITGLWITASLYFCGSIMTLVLVWKKNSAKESFSLSHFSI